MMFNSRFSLLAALMLALGTTTATYAAPLPTWEEQTLTQNPGPNNPGRGSRGGDQWAGKKGWLEQLNLTSEQQQEIQTIRERYEPEMQANHEEIRQSMERMREMMTGSTSDRDLRNQHNQILRARQQIGEMQFEQMLAIRNILTPEQRQQFAQLMQQHRQNNQNPGGNNRNESGNRRGPNSSRSGR